MNTGKCSPWYSNGDILIANGNLAIVLDKHALTEINFMHAGAYRIQFHNADGTQSVSNVQHGVVETFFKLAKAADGEILPIDGWNKTSVIPMQVGWVVKRWNKPTGPVVWAGYFNGSPKMASCDEWLPLKMEK